MRLIGVPTAILSDEETGEITIQTSVIEGGDKRSIVWVDRNRSVFPISKGDNGDSAFEQYAHVVETAIGDSASEPDIRPVVMVGRQGGSEQAIRDMTAKIIWKIMERFQNRANVKNGTFGDHMSEMDMTVRPVPFTVEEAYSAYMTHLWRQVLFRSNSVDQGRLSTLLGEENMSASNILIAYRDSPERLKELRDWKMTEEVYEPYYADLLQRAREGEPSAIRDLEMEMRHSALRLFIEYGRVLQRTKVEFPFVLMTKPDILSQLPFLAGDQMRRIFALEIRRLFGISGNISVKSRFADEKSPPFGDLTVVELANKADKITGEEPDEVRLQIPKIA